MRRAGRKRREGKKLRETEAERLRVLGAQRGHAAGYMAGQEAVQRKLAPFHGVGSVKFPWITRTMGISGAVFAYHEALTSAIDASPQYRRVAVNADTPGIPDPLRELLTERDAVRAWLDRHIAAVDAYMTSDAYLERKRGPRSE